MQTVTDQNVQVRTLAINALGSFGKPAASSLPALTTALHDANPAVQIRAALAIAKIDPKNPAFIPVLKSAMQAGDGKVLLEVGAMGRDAAWATPTLIELLGHPLPQVRALAAQTLGRIGSPATATAKAALQQATHDPNLAVQHAAQAALERIQSESPNSGK
jgi:HEAT repeat protein